MALAILHDGAAADLGADIAAREETRGEIAGHAQGRIFEIIEQNIADLQMTVDHAAFAIFIGEGLTGDMAQDEEEAALVEALVIGVVQIDQAVDREIAGDEGEETRRFESPRDRERPAMDLEIRPGPAVIGARPQPGEVALEHPAGGTGGDRREKFRFRDSFEGHDAIHCGKRE